MGHGMHSGVQIYMCGRRQCDDTFPKKNMSFYFNHPRDMATGLRSQKVWKFKSF
jgi:hypothetical protein